MGIFLAFFVVILLTAGIYLFGYAARHSSLLFVLFLELLLGLVFIFPLLIFADRLSVKEIFSSLSFSNWAWLSGAAVSGYIGGNYFSLLNLKLAGEKVNSLLSPAITALAILSGFFVFDEHLNFIQGMGVLLTLVSIIFFLAYRKSSYSQGQPAKGFLSGLLTIFFVTLTIICSINAINGEVTLFQAIWLRLLIGFILILPFVINHLPIDVFKKDRKFYLAVCSGVLLQTLAANYLWFYSTLHIGIAIFHAILATLPLFVFATEVFILKKEKPSPSFLVVSFLAITGIFLTTFF